MTAETVDGGSESQPTWEQSRTDSLRKRTNREQQSGRTGGRVIREASWRGARKARGSDLTTNAVANE